MQTIAISILLAKHINDIIKGKKTIIESNLEVDMKILISGHHVEITEGIKQSIENKLAKISKHYPSIMTLNSRVTVEPHQQKVEITTNYEGANVTVNASDKKLYGAIASAAKKLNVALARRKGMLSAKLNEKFIVEESDRFQMVS